MRLCKEDNVPNPVLHRLVETKEGERPFTLSPLPGKYQDHPEAHRLGEPCLFQGSIGAAYNKQSLEAHGITHILTCASNINPRFPNDFTYKVLELLDTPTQNIVKHFKEADDWIEEVLRADPKHKVLVHCFAGKSRASTITLSYLMKHHKTDLRTGILHLKAARPIAEPNIGFVV